MKNLLITGGAGFIGANFIRYVLQVDSAVRVVNLDALTYAGSLENLRDLPDATRHTFIQGDICDRPLVDKLLREHQIDTIVHFAAESHVDRSIHNPGQFIQTNIVGTFTLLEAARAAWCAKEVRSQKSEVSNNLATSDLRPLTADRCSSAAVAPRQRFHHVSTDEVFGSLHSQDPAFTETTPYDPSSPYSASKAASDHIVRAYARTYGLPVTMTNCSNNYGPYQFPEKLIPLMILNALEGKPLPVYGDGMQIRDWLYVDDHCEAIWKILSHGKPGETYNIGGDNQPSNLEIVRTICNLIAELRPLSPNSNLQSLSADRQDPISNLPTSPVSGPQSTAPCPLANLPSSLQSPVSSLQSAGHPSSLITFVPDRPGHDRRYAMDISKIKRELGWQPRHTLADGLRQTVQWYLDHPEWIAAIRGQGGYQTWMEKNYTARQEVSGQISEVSGK